MKDKIKLRSRYYDKEEITVDSYTGQPELIKKLNKVIGEKGIEYSSKIVTINYKGRKIPICKRVFEKYKVEFIKANNKDEFINIFDTYNYDTSSGKYAPGTKIYSISEFDQKLIPDYSKLNNGLDILKNYTYGVELETSSSSIDDKIINNLGFAALYDGSITGPEYVSKILSYDNFHYIDNLLEYIKKFSNFNNMCSFHIHIGGFPYSDNNLLSCYLLFQRLSEELNQLIAPYKKDYKFLASKDKDHCKNLVKLPERSVNEIYKLLKIEKYKDDSSHLLQYINQSKWSIPGRYYSVNFMNYICKKPSNKTIEIRSLQMTSDIDYIMTWLILNTAIIDFAINNQKKVLDNKEKIEIQDILGYFLPSNLKEDVMYNIRYIKNIIYSEYYIKNNKMSDPSYVDRLLSGNLKKILKLDKVTTKNSLYTIIDKNYKELSTDGYKSYIEGVMFESSSAPYQSFAPERNTRIQKNAKFINTALDSLADLYNLRVDGQWWQATRIAILNLDILKVTQYLSDRATRHITGIPNNIGIRNNQTSIDNIVYYREYRMPPINNPRTVISMNRSTINSVIDIVRSGSYNSVVYPITFNTYYVGSDYNSYITFRNEEIGIIVASDMSTYSRSVSTIIDRIANTNNGV